MNLPETKMSIRDAVMCHGREKIFVLCHSIDWPGWPNWIPMHLYRRSRAYPLDMDYKPYTEECDLDAFV